MANRFQAWPELLGLLLGANVDHVRAWGNEPAGDADDYFVSDRRKMGALRCKQTELWYRVSTSALERLLLRAYHIKAGSICAEPVIGGDSPIPTCIGCQCLSFEV